MSCENESEAFERSGNAAQATFLLLPFFRKFSVAYRSVSVVEYLLQKPNCVLLNNRCSKDIQIFVHVEPFPTILLMQEG